MRKTGKTRRQQKRREKGEKVKRHARRKAPPHSKKWSTVHTPVHYPRRENKGHKEKPTNDSRKNQGEGGNQEKGGRKGGMLNVRYINAKHQVDWGTLERGKEW